MALTEFEYSILDKVIPTQSLGDGLVLKTFIRRLVENEKANILSKENMTEHNFKLLQSQTANNLFQYLRDNEFLGEREGAVYFLTEKGKQLRRQGSLDNYISWRKAQGEIIRDELTRTMNQGYLEEKQKVVKNELQQIKRRSYAVYIIPLIILVFIGLVLHYYKFF